MRLVASWIVALKSFSETMLALILFASKLQTIVAIISKGESLW